MGDGEKETTFCPSREAVSSLALFVSEKKNEKKKEEKEEERSGKPRRFRRLTACDDMVWYRMV